MTLEMFFVLGLVLIMLAGLIFEIARPDIVVFIIWVVFLITGVLTPDEALSGFANQGMLTVALLFIVAGAIEKSGIFQQLTNFVMGNTSSGRRALTKILIPVSFLSGFLNNTPIVVTLTPIIRKWCEDRGLSPSKFLIPLSYATILGGMLTLMGTSTNLIVNGLLIKEGYDALPFFKLSVVGLPLVIIGLFLIIIVIYPMLPAYKKKEKRDSGTKDYLTEMRIETDYPHIGRSVADAGLRQLKGLFLIEIIRATEKISPVGSDTLIREGDRLIFTGDVGTIGELQNTKGLRLTPESETSIDHLLNGHNQVVEAVVSHQSTLLDQRVKDTNFRSKFDAAVIAVHRHQERIKGKIGDIILKPGDTLLMLTGNEFRHRNNLFNDFYVVTPMKSPFVSQSDNKNGWLTLFSLGAAILLVVFGVLTMFKAMCLEVIFLLVLRILTPQEAKSYVQFQVLLLIASALGVGQAIAISGLADFIAEYLVDIFNPLGVTAILLVIFILTNIFTEVITNNAAAVIMFPIAMSMAAKLSISPTAFAIIIAIAASASFLTPIGYQTNLIVYGPGGYKFSDYLKAGFPLTVTVMIVTIVIVRLTLI